jgi:hypothetical protein
MKKKRRAMSDKLMKMTDAEFLHALEHSRAWPPKEVVAAAAIARLRKLRPDLPSPTLADALEPLCHCGEKLNEHCTCNAGGEHVR